MQYDMAMICYVYRIVRVSDLTSLRRNNWIAMYYVSELSRVPFRMATTKTPTHAYAYAQA